MTLVSKKRQKTKKKNTPLGGVLVLLVLWDDREESNASNTESKALAALFEDEVDAETSTSWHRCSSFLIRSFFSLFFLLDEKTKQTLDGRGDVLAFLDKEREDKVVAREDSLADEAS